ncbi:hypothetical protein MPER_06288, partial [Moniliophthora perniciosa FA553]
DNGNVDLEKKKGKSKNKVKDSASEVEVEQKKKSKKRKHEEIESQQNAEAGTEAGEEASGKKKKKKNKRSHDAKKADEDVDMQAIAEEDEKRDKKDKKKKDKKDKKDKKKKHSETTTAESSKAASPSRSTAPKASPSEVSKFLAKNNVSIHVSPGQPEVTPILAFDQLDIPDSLRSFSAKFKEPSPIQTCTWPPSLNGKDVVGIAETGSGKRSLWLYPHLRDHSSPARTPDTTWSGRPEWSRAEHMLVRGS